MCVCVCMCVHVHVCVPGAGTLLEQKAPPPVLTGELVKDPKGPESHEAQKVEEAHGADPGVGGIPREVWRMGWAGGGA